MSKQPRSQVIFVLAAFAVFAGVMLASARRADRSRSRGQYAAALSNWEDEGGASAPLHTHSLTPQT